MQLLTGWWQSLRPGSGYINLNVDVAFTAVFQSGPFPEFVATRMGLRGVADLGKLKKSDFARAKAAVMQREVGEANLSSNI